MLSVDAALGLICESVTPREAIECALVEAQGLVTAAAVVSAVDSPPFDKSMMDGYAVRAADVREGAELPVVAEVTAGRVFEGPLAAGTAVRIMTGAPIPNGADAIVRVEETTSLNNGDRVRLNLASCRVGRDIVPRGQSMRAGDAVIPAGRVLRVPEIALLAEMGHARVQVRPRPTVAIIATGDELVPIEAMPGPAQIRNTNEPMLAAQVRACGAEPRPLGIARDEASDLQRLIQKGLEADLLCLSGGVSAGKLDLVPAALAACGVEQVFHKLAMKPGKPLWFGRLPGERAGDGRARWIFGLPGNPVSSMVCFDLFVRTALRRLQGIEPATPVPIPARIGTNLAFKDDRPTWLPVRVEWSPQGPLVHPVGWRGSSDLRATVEAQGTAHFPAGEREYRVGDAIQFYAWSLP
jgi:molybdopterin molybdotransferase